MMAAETPTQRERRRFFRIEDEVKLVYRSAEARPPGTSEQPFLPLMGGLESISQDANKQLTSVERFYPEVAAYVKTLESKLELLARSVVLMQEPALMQQSKQMVSISASGVAFEGETHVSSGEVLEIKMVLLASMILIVNPVKVVYCKPSDPGDEALPWQIGVDYIDMGASMQEQLIRHVFNRQQAQRRRLL